MSVIVALPPPARLTCAERLTGLLALAIGRVLLAAEDLRRVRDAGPELDYGRYQDLWFYLATRDPRITRAWTD